MGPQAAPSPGALRVPLADAREAAVPDASGEGAEGSDAAEREPPKDESPEVESPEGEPPEPQRESSEPPPEDDGGLPAHADDDADLAATPSPAGAVEVSSDAPMSEAPSSPAPASPSAGGGATSKPLLASEALMEDLAPVEPLFQGARILCVVAGLSFAVLGALPLLGVHTRGRAALLPSLLVGAVTLFAAVARVTYRKRAVAMVALGAIVASLGIAGMGPAHGIAEGGAVWSVARIVAAAALPAALLFRARYRAFEGARLLLGLAFIAALPFAVHAVLLLVDPSAPFGFAQIGAVLALALFVAGLPGFMGSETTAAGGFVGSAMIAAFALQAGLQRLGALVPGSLGEIFGGVAQAASEATQLPPEDGDVLRRAASHIAVPASALWDAAVTSVALAASALLSAVGLFQILAWRFAPAARKIDVRKPVDGVPEERPSSSEWSTRH